MLTFLKMLRRDERGVSALEYAILGAIILVALLGALSAANITGIFDDFGSALTDAAAR